MENAVARARSGKISGLVVYDRAASRARRIPQTATHFLCPRSHRNSRSRYARYSGDESTITFSARSVTRASPRRAYSSVLRRNGLPLHRKTSWPNKRCPSWDSRSRVGGTAQTNETRLGLPRAIMTVVHDHLDNYLAADLHSELSGPERDELNAHLLECAQCRKIHRETRAMNKILEETLTQEKPDPAFEQRMLAGFHKRIPLRRGGFGNVIVDLIRSRGGQAIAAVALLLVLVQVGGILTYHAQRAYRRSSHFATAGSGEDRLAPFANAVFGPRQSGTASS